MPECPISLAKFAVCVGRWLGGSVAAPFTGTTEHALLAPQAEVIEIQSMYQVVVVSPENKAIFRPGQGGRARRAELDHTEGLKPGEKIIVQGFMKVRGRDSGHS
jgi:hypothetical protein